MSFLIQNTCNEDDLSTNENVFEDEIESPAESDGYDSEQHIEVCFNLCFIIYQRRKLIKNIFSFIHFVNS